MWVTLNLQEKRRSRVTGSKKSGKSLKVSNSNFINSDFLDEDNSISDLDDKAFLEVTSKTSKNITVIKIFFKEISSVNISGDHNKMRQFLKDHKILLSKSNSGWMELNINLQILGNVVDDDVDEIDGENENASATSVAR